MEALFKKALDGVKAEDALKKRTADYILNVNADLISIDAHTKNKVKPLYIKKFVAAACAVLILCAVPVGAYAVYQTPTSYVSIDINPSVELGINPFGKVISVTAYNDDGQSVIEGLSLLNTSVGEAVNLLVTAASANGFIKDDGSTFIAVTVETNNENKAEKLKADAENGAKTAIASEENTATIETDDMALDFRDEAIEHGITPGKLNLIKKLQALDDEVTIEECENASVAEIQKRYIELKKMHDHDKNAEDASVSAGSPSNSPAEVNPSPQGSNVHSNKPDKNNDQYDKPNDPLNDDDDQTDFHQDDDDNDDTYQDHDDQAGYNHYHDNDTRNENNYGSYTR